MRIFRCLLKFVAETAEQISIKFGLDVENNLNEPIDYILFNSKRTESRAKDSTLKKTERRETDVD